MAVTADLMRPPVSVPAVITPQNGASVVRRYGGVTGAPVQPLTGGMVAGIFAPGGTGKTTLAATITDSELGRPAAIINMRGNPHVVMSKSDVIDVYDAKSFSQVEDIRAAMENDRNCPYKTIILDTVTEMLAKDLKDRHGAMVDFDWNKYNLSTGAMLQFHRNFIDMARGPQRFNVIFIYQEALEMRAIRGKKESPRGEVALNKALQFQVPGLLTILGRLYVAEDIAPYRRVLDFRPIETIHQAKLQLDPNDPIMAQIPMEVFNPSMASLVDTIVGRKPWPTEKHRDPFMGAAPAAKRA